MLTVIYIAVFGALGCVARYFLSGWTYDKLGWHFPWGTLSVNVVGAFIIGLVMELGLRNANIPANLRIGLVTGFLGGLTTFSTFSAEVVALLQRHHYGWALLVAGAHLAGSLLLTGIGIVLARWLWLRA